MTAPEYRYFTPTSPLIAERRPDMTGATIPKFRELRRAESVGRPVGSPEWLTDMEARLCRPLAPQRRGPNGKAG